MGQLPILTCGEGEAMWWPHRLRLTQHIILLPRLPSFPPQAFPTTVSSLTSAWSISPHSTAALALKGEAPQSLNSSFQPLHHLEYEWLRQGLSDSDSIWASTGQLFPSQPEMFLLWLRQLPQCGDWIPASVPPPAESRPSSTNTPVFPP